ncbi:hypothetical protein LY76DRAFT_383442 [Colletotrichum caudatum]|nr:hypothetical protein LY76DRAFT_383442 [Colletotrichum caudatum]
MKCFLTSLLLPIRHQPTGNEEEDDENDLDAGLQQFQNQNAYSAIVPSVAQPQNMAVNTLAGHAINSIEQGYGQMTLTPPTVTKARQCLMTIRLLSWAWRTPIHMKPMLHGNFTRRRPPFGQSGQT